MTVNTGKMTTFIK